MKDFFAKKGIGWYILSAAALTTVLAFIFYLVNGFATISTNGLLVFLFIVAIALEGVTLWKDFFGIGPVVANVVLGIVTAIIAATRYNYVAYAVTGVSIGGTASFETFIAMVVFVVLSLGLTLASNYVKLEKEINA